MEFLYQGNGKHILTLNRGWNPKYYFINSGWIGLNHSFVMFEYVFHNWVSILWEHYLHSNKFLHYFMYFLLLLCQIYWIRTNHSYAPVMLEYMSHIWVSLLWKLKIFYNFQVVKVLRTFSCTSMSNWAELRLDYSMYLH